MNSSTIPPPVLRSEDGPIQAVLTCSLCCEIPLDPVETPCEHVFCRPCIFRALESRPECPNDRHFLQASDLQPIRGICRRIWEHVPVSCPGKECDWTGTMGSYIAHTQRCYSLANVYRGRSQELEATLKNMKSNHERREASHMARIAALESLVARLNNQIENTQAQRMTLDSSYRYDRSRVVELTQLICQDLENRPVEINENRIYNCVKNCYDDFTRGYNDNPEHYRIDMRMLLNVCRASTWFSQKQLANFARWSTESDFGV